MFCHCVCVYELLLCETVLYRRNYSSSFPCVPAFFGFVSRVELDSHVRECVQSYIQPWLVVSRR